MTAMRRMGEDDVHGLSGERARLWGFSPTHDRLVIEITFPSGDRSYLQCVMTQRTCLPTLWRWESPQLGAIGELLQLRDGEIDIRCEELWLQATPELNVR
jgi:hypothetical protein